jgi:NAD(P)-dependent dehydrogenase (short-subunit alcohol dehydrogenase family)
MKVISALLIAAVSCALYFAGVDSYFSSSASLLGVPGKRLEGRVCIVTGGARGIGKGIALGLGDEGATVYVTGRTEKDVLQTAQEVTSRGGRGIAVVVDHSKVEEIQGLFDKIRKEQSELHLLVNNCYSAAGNNH